MNQIIEKYYKDNKLPEPLLMNKMQMLERNPDISSEFEYWINNQRYKSDGLEIEGYTAEKLSLLSRHLIGEGSFMLMIELREHPSTAHKIIEKGFRVK